MKKEKEITKRTPVPVISSSSTSVIFFKYIELSFNKLA
jgi:hypothetical protein